MRLHRVGLINYRGVAERDVEVAEDGVTVLVGDNETGKSSLLEAFDLLLQLPVESRHRRLEGVRPVGRDVATEVHAVFTLGDGGAGKRLDYRKRWFSERRTELAVTDTDGRAVSMTGREAHDEAARLFAQHVDPTLWQALVVAQTNTLELPEAQHVSTVITALERETASADADNATPLLKRITDEFHRYFTPKGHKPTGEYARAVAALEEARETVRAAEKRTAEVAQDVEQAQRLAEDCERLRRGVDELDAEVARLEEKRKDAGERLSALTRLASEVDLATERLNAARADHERREVRRSDVDELQRSEDEQRRALAAADERLQETESRLTAHGESLAAARQARATAREETARLDAVLAGLRDRAELTELTGRIRDIERAQAAERDAAADLQRHRIDGEAAERAEQVHREVLAAQAAAHAGAPKASLRVLGDTPVNVDGRPLDQQGSSAAHEVVVETDTTVTADGVLELSIRPGDEARTLRARLDAAEHAERELLAELGVSDLDAVRASAHARAEAEQARELARRTLAARLGEENLSDLMARADALRARVGEDDDADDAEEPEEPEAPEADGANEPELRNALQRARRAEAEAAQTLATVEERELAVRKEVEAARDEATSCRVRAEQVREQRRSAERTLAEARAEESDEQVAERQRAATEHAESAQEDHRQAAETLTATGADRVEEELAEAVRRRDEATRTVETYRGDLRQVEGRLEMAGAHGISSELERARAAEAGAERSLHVVERRAKAINRLADTIERHRSQAHRRYAAPLRERIDALGRQVYGPSFAIELGEDLSVVARETDRVRVPVAALSTGAREQLATIVRLAIAELAGVGGESVPVVLDDALGWSDPGRLRSMGALLERTGRGGQVLLLTCTPERYALIPGVRLVRLS